MPTASSVDRNPLSMPEAPPRALARAGTAPTRREHGSEDRDGPAKSTTRSAQQTKTGATDDQHDVLPGAVGRRGRAACRRRLPASRDCTRARLAQVKQGRRRMERRGGTQALRGLFPDAPQRCVSRTPPMRRRGCTAALGHRLRARGAPRRTAERNPAHPPGRTRRDAGPQRGGRFGRAARRLHHGRLARERPSCSSLI